jgi:hypothetical protein
MNGANCQVFAISRFSTLHSRDILTHLTSAAELLSNLVFEGCWSCGDLVGVCGFNSVFERDACDDFREVVKAA